LQDDPEREKSSVPSTTARDAYPKKVAAFIGFLHGQGLKTP
jgi:hypothetical protein